MHENTNDNGADEKNIGRKKNSKLLICSASVLCSLLLLCIATCGKRVLLLNYIFFSSRTYISKPRNNGNSNGYDAYNHFIFPSAYAADTAGIRKEQRLFFSGANFLNEDISPFQNVSAYAAPSSPPFSSLFHDVGHSASYSFPAVVRKSVDLENKRSSATKLLLSQSSSPTSSHTDKGGGEGGGDTDGIGTPSLFIDINCVLLAGCLLLCFCIGYLTNTAKIPHLSESAAAMLVGFCVGLIAYVVNISEENNFLRFDAQFFYFVLLPPIIFEAGFCLNIRSFLENICPILLFAIVGTIISTVVIAYGIMSVRSLIGMEGNVHETRGFAWSFAALISAIDPVATLSVLGGSKFERNEEFYSILFGESVLNDAVAIALTHSVQRVYFSGSFEAAEAATVFNVLFDFLHVSLGSLVVGLLIGAICFFSFKRLRYLKRLPQYEVAITFLTAYLAFGLSELLSFSGILALFFCGAMLGHYNVHNLSPKSRYSIGLVFQTVALLCEKCVFAYLGVVAGMGIGRKHWNLLFVFFALLFCALGRAAHVFPLSLLMNVCRSRRDNRGSYSLDFGKQCVMWLSGLRGAIAFALAMSIPCTHDMWREYCHHNKDLTVTTTLTLVVLTTVFVGSIIEAAALKVQAIRPITSRYPDYAAYKFGGGGTEGDGGQTYTGCIYLEEKEGDGSLTCESQNMRNASKHCCYWVSPLHNEEMSIHHCQCSSSLQRHSNSSSYHHSQCHHNHPNGHLINNLKHNFNVPSNLVHARLVTSHPASSSFLTQQGTSSSMVCRGYPDMLSVHVAKRINTRGDDVRQTGGRGPGEEKNANEGKNENIAENRNGSGGVAIQTEGIRRNIQSKKADESSRVTRQKDAKEERETFALPSLMKQNNNANMESISSAYSLLELPAYSRSAYPCEGTSGSPSSLLTSASSPPKLFPSSSVSPDALRLVFPPVAASLPPNSSACPSFSLQRARQDSAGANTVYRDIANDEEQEGSYDSKFLNRIDTDQIDRNNGRTHNHSSAYCCSSLHLGGRNVEVVSSGEVNQSGRDNVTQETCLKTNRVLDIFLRIKRQFLQEWFGSSDSLEDRHSLANNGENGGFLPAAAHPASPPDSSYINIPGNDYCGTGNNDSDQYRQSDESNLPSSVYDQHISRASSNSSALSCSFSSPFAPCISACSSYSSTPSSAPSFSSSSFFATSAPSSSSSSSHACVSPSSCELSLFSDAFSNCASPNDASAHLLPSGSHSSRFFCEET